MAPAPLTLVTGATGLVGNNVVRRLVELDRPVRVLARSGYDPRVFAGLNIEVAIGDVRDAAAVRTAVAGTRSVVHAAGFVQIGRRHLVQHRAINVEGTRCVASAALSAGTRLVYVSSCDALGVRSLAEPADEDTPQDHPARVPYALSKREAEKVVLDLVAKGLDAVIVNPGFMLGPWDWKPSSGRMLLQVALGRGWFAPRGHFSVCDVRDVAEGIIAALDRGATGRRYVLAGTTMSYLAAWRLFAEVAQARRPLCTAGPLMLKLAGWAGDLTGWLSGREPDVNSAAIAHARLPKHYSSARAQAELGYRIRHPRESAADAWQWFCQHGYAQSRSPTSSPRADAPLADRAEAHSAADGQGTRP